MANKFITVIPRGSPQDFVSEPFRIAKIDISSAIQISGDAGDKAELQRSYDGGVSFEGYDIETVRKEISVGGTNAAAIDTIGIWRMKLVATSGNTVVNLDLARDYAG